MTLSRGVGIRAPPVLSAIGGNEYFGSNNQERNRTVSWRNTRPPLDSEDGSFNFSNLGDPPKSWARWVIRKSRDFLPTSIRSESTNDPTPTVSLMTIGFGKMLVLGPGSAEM